jgi:MoxR-like ATPase
MLLVGPPATGKTHLAQHCGLDGRKVYSITFTPDMSAADLIGCYTQAKGEMYWSDGPALMAWREGARLNLNEIDRGSAETESILYALLDDMSVARLTLPTGETVQPHARFQAVCTSNVSGKMSLPEALLSRLPVQIAVTDIHPLALATLDKDLQPLAIRTNAASENERVSFRTWQTFQHLRRTVGPEMALYACFGERAKDFSAALAIRSL